MPGWDHKKFVASDSPFSKIRGKHQRIEIVKTMSNAGMRKPQRIPTIYRADSKLLSPDSIHSSTTGDNQDIDAKELNHLAIALDCQVTGRDRVGNRTSPGEENLRLPLTHAVDTSRRDRGPEIHLVIPTQAINNPEVFANEIVASILRNTSGKQEDLKEASDSVSVISPVTPESSILPRQAVFIRDPMLSISQPTQVGDQQTRTPTPESEDFLENTSCYSISPPSSASSVAEKIPEKKAVRTVSGYSITSPAEAGVFDFGSDITFPTPPSRSNFKDSKNKPLPPEPARMADPLILHKKMSDVSLSGSPGPLVSRYSAVELNSLDQEFKRTNPRPYRKRTMTKISLEQATMELESQLTDISTHSSPSIDSRRLVRHKTPELIPEEPCMFRAAEETVVHRDGNGSTRPRTRLRPASTILTQSVFCDGHDGCVYCDVANTVQYKGHTDQNAGTGGTDTISSHAADTILVRIMESSATLKDLFSTAVINKGFYLTFKRHELNLIRNVMFKMSPAVWEHQGLSQSTNYSQFRPNIDRVDEQTPAAYLKQYKQNCYTLTALKSMILSRCQTFLRMDTIIGLAGMDFERSKELDEAFWRIWSFCSIFGCGKAREHDTIAQIDWLNGGQLANVSRTPMLRPTSFAGEEDIFAMDSALFNPPECFGKGNGNNGLTAYQLYDMIEIWNCFGVLLQHLSTDVIEARTHGIFPESDINDETRDLGVLEEWTYYILTLGPSAILNLSLAFHGTTASAFTTATECGWTKWEPPTSGFSRSSFMKEALTRVYNQRLATFTTPTSPNPQPIDHTHPQVDGTASKTNRSSTVRDRQLALAAELQKHKQATLPQTSATIHPKAATFSTERPMSSFPQVINQLNGPRNDPRSSLSTPNLYEKLESDTSKMLAAHIRSVSVPAGYHRGAPKSVPAGIVDPIDVALWTLTSDLGFSLEDATWALRKCETGEHVEVNRAVDMLLRQRELGHSTVKKLGAWMGLGTPVSESASSPPTKSCEGWWAWEALDVGRAEIWDDACSLINGSTASPSGLPDQVHPGTPVNPTSLPRSGSSSSMASISSSVLSHPGGAFPLPPTSHPAKRSNSARRSFSLFTRSRSTPSKLGSMSKIKSKSSASTSPTISTSTCASSYKTDITSPTLVGYSFVNADVLAETPELAGSPTNKPMNMHLDILKEEHEPDAKGELVKDPSDEIIRKVSSTQKMQTCSAAQAKESGKRKLGLSRTSTPEGFVSLPYSLPLVYR